MRLILANLRESNNMTQAEIAKCARISQGYYSDIESGLRCPSPNVAGKIAKVLDIAEQEMFRVFYAQQDECVRSV